MKFLITGAGGQLGMEWCEYLSKNNYSFIGLDSKDLNITKRDQIEDAIKKHKPEIIINCAAYTNVDGAEDERDLADNINSKSVGVLAKLCQEKGIKLVHYSTDYVFSGLIKDKQSYQNGYPENADTSPTNIYGKTKLDGERLIENSGCDFLIIRVSWLCGKNGSNFVKTMIKLGSEKDELSVVDDQFGAPTFCFDVVSQSMELLTRDLEGIFHLSSTGIISWYDLAKKIFEISSTKIKVKPISSQLFKSKAKRPAFSKLNSSKFEQLTGLSMNHWEAGLSKLLSQL